MKEKNKKMIKGLLIDVNKCTSEVVEIEDTLNELYRILDCDTIDIVSRRVHNKYFTIVCDDEGLFKANNRVSALTNVLNPSLVGNLFIVSSEVDDEGNLISLSDEEINYLKKYVVSVTHTPTNTKYKILVGLNY